MCGEFPSLLDVFDDVLVEPLMSDHDEDGMCAIGDVTGYFCQMLGHCVGITPRHDESGGLAELGADGTEDVGGAGSLVMRRERP